MPYRCLATDYDGTIAKDGVVDEPTIAALRRLKASGVTIVLVSGRELTDFFNIFPAATELFDRLVLENGAISFDPKAEHTRLLAAAPPEPFVTVLRQANVPVSVGHSIVATFDPHGPAVAAALAESGCDWKVVLNKEAIMVLPPNVTKATGLAAALEELGLTPAETVAMGDAENDHAMLQYCGLAVAPDNALQEVKDDADLVTAGARGHGMQELIARWLDNGLTDLPPRTTARKPPTQDVA